MTFVFKTLAVSIAAAVIASPSSFAQSSPDTREATVIVTANRIPLVAQEVLADHLEISTEDIARAGASTIVDLLQQQRGIEISRYGGAGTVASVFVRGSANAQNVVLVDGVRTQSTTVGGASWSSIPLAEIDHIEIAYGPLSSLYGADAVGGVIQIFTKRAKANTVAHLSFGLGSYGLRQMQAGVAGGSSQHINYALNFSREQADGFSASKPNAGPYTFNADKDGYDSHSFSGHLGWEVAQGHEVGLNLLQNHINAQFDAGPTFDDHNVSDLGTFALYSKNKFTPDWISTAQFARSEDRLFTDASYGASRIDSIQNDVSWQNDIRFDKDTLSLIAEHKDEQVNAEGSPLERSRVTNSAAASYVLKRDAHLASASLRYDRSSQFGAHTTGSFAYGYRFTSDFRLNASVGTSYRAPSFNELYYPGSGIENNRPEQGKNAEIGGYFDDGTTQFSLVYFHNKITDLLGYSNICPVEQATHPYGCSYNVNQATLSGVTIGASTQVGKLYLRAAFDLQNPHDDTSNLQLARRAKQHGSLSAEYAADTWKIGVEGIVSGSRYDDAGNNNRLGGYGIMNLYANYQVCSEVSLLARWNNLFNKDYELTRTYATPGSNVFVGLRYTFK